MSDFAFSDPVMVLGFCRSGTTLVAEMVHQGGVPMVTPEEEEAASRYDDGEKYERALCQKLNTEIIGLQRRPRCISSVWKHEQAALRPEQLQRLFEETGSGPWGFKDPLTTITYSVWCEAFPRGARLHTYRGHEEILRHYFQSGKSRYRALELTRRALRAWVHYNERMLENLKLDYEAKRPAALVRYEELMQDEQLIHRLQDATGVKLFDARNPNLRRSKGSLKRSAFQEITYRLAEVGYRERLARCYRELAEARLAPTPGGVN